jgi:hypothetical protein
MEVREGVVKYDEDPRLWGGKEDEGYNLFFFHVHDGHDGGRGKCTSEPNFGN